MTTERTPRQRQRLRQQLNKHRHERAQFYESFTGWDGEGEVRVKVDAREAALAAMCGYAQISLETAGEHD